MTKTRSLQEVLYVAHFATRLTVLDIAAWFNHVADRYPVFQEGPPWGPVIWQDIGAPGPQIMLRPPSTPRIIALSEDQQWSIQTQSDRVAVGWRRLEPTGQETNYPGFAAMFERVIATLDSFRAWWLERSGSPAAFTLVELNYFNAFPFDHAGRALRVSEVFKFVVPKAGTKIGNLNASWFVQLEPPEKRRVQCTMAMGATVDCPSAAIFNFMGMAQLEQQGSPAELQSIFDILHGAISTAYSDSINIEIIGSQE